MKFVSRWLINAAAVAISVILIPGFTISGYIFPALGFLLAGYLVSLLTPDMLDFVDESKILEGPQFCLLCFLFNVLIIMIVVAVTPYLDASGFIPNIAVGIISAVVNTFLQFKFKEKNPAHQQRDFSSDF